MLQQQRLIRALAFGLRPALLLVPLACLALPPAAKEPRKVEGDAAGTRADSPKVIARDLAKKEASPGPLIGDFPAKTLRAPSDPRAPRGACEHSRSDRCRDLADRYFVHRPVLEPVALNSLAE